MFPIGEVIGDVMISERVAGCAERGLYAGSPRKGGDPDPDPLCWITLALDAELDDERSPHVARERWRGATFALNPLASGWLYHEGQRFAALVERRPLGVTSDRVDGGRLAGAAKGICLGFMSDSLCLPPLGGIRPETIFVARAAEWRHPRFIVDPDTLCFTGLAPFSVGFSALARSLARPIPPLFPLLHLAPERLMGAPATRESDVWELAFTLQRWFSPGSPYESDQLAAQIDQVMRGRRRALTGRHAGIDEIVAAALAPTPGDRPRPVDLQQAVRAKLPS